MCDEIFASQRSLRENYRIFMNEFFSRKAQENAKKKQFSSHQLSFASRSVKTKTVKLN